MQHFILYQNTWNIGILYDEIFIWLVVSTPLKNMKVIWDDYSQVIWKNIQVMFQSPPTSHDCRMFPVSGCFLGFHRVPTSRALQRPCLSGTPGSSTMSPSMFDTRRSCVALSTHKEWIITSLLILTTSHKPVEPMFSRGCGLETTSLKYGLDGIMYVAGIQH